MNLRVNMNHLVYTRPRSTTPLIGHEESPVSSWRISKHLNSHRSTIILIATAVATLMATHVSFAQRQLLDQPARPSSQNLIRSLPQRVTVTWQGQELAVALQRLASTGQLALWLDRRVDRRQIIDAQFVDLPLGQALAEIAKKQSLGVAQIGELVYIGPRQAALELPTLLQQARSKLNALPQAARQSWLQSQATGWPRLSEPRALASEWLSKSNIALIGGEQIAHDLWQKQKLPILPLVDRMVLLLVGFDFTCEVAPDGESCKVVQIARPLKLTRQRTVAPARPRRSKKSTSRQRFSLRLENQPLGRVLDKFAEQLQLEVVWPQDSVGRSNLPRKRLVSCDVQNVELDELLSSILAAANLQHRLEGKKVIILDK